MDDKIYNNLAIRSGKVVEIHSENRTRVIVQDLETGMKSPWLSVIVPFAGDSKGAGVFHIDEGDEVAYQLSDTDAGYVLGQIFTKGQTVPGSDNIDVLHQTDVDNMITVDRAAKRFSIAMQNLLMEIGADIEIRGDAIGIESATGLNLDAPDIKLGSAATELLIKATTYFSALNTMLGALSSHTHGVAPDAGLGTAITTFISGQSGYVTTKTKAE